MEGVVKILREILNPSEEFTPMPFWFFNDALNEEHIRKQLEDYVEKGVHGFVLHPRIGIPEDVPYLSESYFKAVRFIVKTADELKMKVVLYDEGMYPSGSAHGMVAAKSPEYASKGIRLVSAEEFVEGQQIAEFDDGSRLVYGFTGGTIRGIHFGEDDGEAGAPASADILNPDAVDEFISLTHDRYYKELKEYFGSTVIAFFTDEPSSLGRNAGNFREWIPGLEKEICGQGGRLQELRSLFTREKNETTEIYHKLIKRGYREIFYRRLSQWCEEHGIVLMGHPEASDDVEEQLYFQIPGQDLIMRRVSPETGGLTEFDSVQAKLAADIARHLGCRRNANECFGVCFREQIPWYFKGEDMKWYIDWLGIRGVNLFVPHAFYYSVEGGRGEERPPDVGPNNIWWPHYKKVSDYMKRLSYLMTDSVNGAKAAVLCDNNQVPYKELAVLYENQVEFNYLPISLLPECRIKDGKLCIREYVYDAVLNVTNPAWDEMVGEMKNYHNAESLAAEGLYQVVKTAEPCKDLRVSKLCKQGVDMFLFGNEGSGRIMTHVSLAGAESCGCGGFQCADAQEVICVDLWRGEAVRKSVCGSRDQLEIVLQPKETLLVIPMQEDIKAADLLTTDIPEKYLGDFTDRFDLVEKKDNRAVYELSYEASEITGGEVFTVTGEEMVECYCNGELADAALWSPYRIHIGKYLKEGCNELKIVVTGSAANVHCGAELPFGLGI